MHDVVAILEAVYRVEQPAPDWIRGVLTAVAPLLDQGSGVFGYLVETCRPDAFQASELYALGADAEPIRKGFDHWQRTMPPRIRHLIHTFAPSGFALQIPFATDSHRVLADETHGFPDIYGVNGLDASGRGCVVAAPYPKRVYDFTLQDPVLWARVAAHLAAGARLITRLAAVGTAVDNAGDAVFDPGGRMLHANGGTRAVIERALLREGVVSLDRARSRRGRKNARSATALWRAMVAGEWTLIDHFDSGTRRYVVAVPNRVRADPVARLSAREAEVFRAVGLGHSNKLIAYELGVSPSSVATHLARAARKLGVTSRAELIDLARRAALPAGGNDGP